MSRVLEILAALCRAAGHIMRWRRERDRAALSRAIREGDEEEVSRRHNELLRIAPFAALLALALGGGCAARTLTVNEPMRPVRLELEGVPGWWLSDSLYEATLLRMDALRNGQ